MAVKIYNSLTRQIENFLPEHSQVRMFVCGPTVYDYAHIGNFRSFTVFDAFAKYLRYQGYKVFYLQNITDIDDKIIRKALDEKTTPQEIARKYEHAFRNDLQFLNINSVSEYARATEYIDEIIEQIKALIAKGHAYDIEDGIYFDLASFPDYGQLSGRTKIQDDDAISRIDENTNKRNAGDFCLWKRSKPDEPKWPSPWGEGRPGWHIEDTAISNTYFGPQYDLHGGGHDLMFPHHEAEIAQQEAASGKKPFVKYWMHSGFLTTKKDKMSKSAGNFKTIHDIKGLYSSEAIRFYLLSAHWRAQLEFDDKSLDQTEAAVARIGEFMHRLKMYEEQKPLEHSDDKEMGVYFDDGLQAIKNAMAEDFNTPRALGVLFDLIRAGNQFIDEKKFDLHSAKKILDIMDFFDHIFGIVPFEQKNLPEEVQKLIADRQSARDQKDFTTSDQLRDKIALLGYSIDDTAYGPLVKKK